MSRHQHSKEEAKSGGASTKVVVIIAVILLAFVAWLVVESLRESAEVTHEVQAPQIQRTQQRPEDLWIERASKVTELFHHVYTPCWEGAYGAIGDAYLFAATNDSSLLRYHLVEHDMRRMCEGTWVDDRAWIGLAEFTWWHFTGRNNWDLVQDARRRYIDARNDGRLSNHEGFWSWYNWSPTSRINERIFTNSNMNQMASVACWLYEATGEKQFLDDALLVWNGDRDFPGIEKTLYKGNGRWEGKPGLAAFGKQLPWDGVEYATLAGLLYRITKEPKYRQIVIETTKRIMDPANGWVDAQDFFQIHMDGNGAFVNFLFDAYTIAPDELKDIPLKVQKMLEHVWTNNHGLASVTLHRESDHGIRNGWNPHGGEDGYGVDEVGTVHAQGEAARAFGIFAYWQKVAFRSVAP